MSTDLVFNENGKALTNSLLVAKTFGKEHRRVTQDIRNLACSDNFRLHNFVQTTYLLRVMRDIMELSCSEVFRLGNFADTSYVDEPDVAKRDMGVIRKILATAENSAVLSEGRNLSSFELVKVVNGDKV